MTLSVVTVADSISKLSVSGVTIKDLDQILDNVTSRDTPVMMPAPQFFTAPEVDRVSMGTGSTAQTDVSYTLNYRFFFEEVGANRSLSDVYQDLVTKTMLIVDALIANDVVTGAIDLQFIDVGAFGVVTDPVGESFFGVDIGIRIMEFENG